MKSPRSQGDDGSSTSSSLLVRVCQSDPEAWEKLTRLYGPMVYGWARNSGLQPQDAADVMQNVFTSLITHIVRFRKQESGDSFRGWLWTVTRNKVRDHFREQKGHANASGGTNAFQQFQQLPQSAEHSSEADSQSGGVEISAVRRRALELVRGDFEDRNWQAFWRAAVEGDAPADVAADLGISVWAVYKARSRVLQRLRDEFQGLLD